MINKNAPFVTVEGMDGAGKSSHIDKIVATLEEAGWTVVRTREPGGTELGEQLRERILNEEMSIEIEIDLLFQSRRDLLEKVIVPNLEKGIAIVCDRFTDSTYAYQGGEYPHMKPVIKQYELDVHGTLTPDMTLLFDLPVEISKQRLDFTGKIPDKFESKDEAYFEKVRNSYLERVSAEPERFRVIDSNQPKDKVSEDVGMVMQDFINVPSKKKKFKM